MSFEVAVDFGNENLKFDCPLSESEFGRAGRVVTASLSAGAEEYFLTLLNLGAEPQLCGLRFCEKDEMRDVYEEFKGTRRVTDILSFPNSENEFVFDGDYLGDLIICSEVVKSYARQKNLSYAEHMMEVFVHGLLHLWGFEHVGVSALRAQNMRQWQKRLLEEIL